MILSDLNGWVQESEGFHPLLNWALEYLRSRDFSHVEPGKYEIQGNDMFALVQTPLTGPRAERKAEHHRKYIDIQFWRVDKKLSATVEQPETKRIWKIICTAPVAARMGASNGCGKSS